MSERAAAREGVFRIGPGEIVAMAAALMAACCVPGFPGDLEAPTDRGDRGGEGVAGEPDPSTPQARAVDAAVRGLAPRGGPGFALAIVEDGEVVFKRGYGLADVSSGAAITPRTPFRLASVSKPLTATGVLVLVERGDLALSDPVSRHLAAFPYGDRITVEHLLQHTSGLPHYEDLPERFERDRPTNADMLDFLAQSRPRVHFGPGERFDYNNLAYDLLALVIEAASGQPFARFMREAVFGPLGMRDTRVIVAGERIPGRAIGYRLGRRGVEVDDDDPLNNLVGAGGIASTLDDLLLFERELRRPSLLTPQTWAQAMRPGRLKGGGRTEYGYGLEIVEEDGVVTVQHDGSWVGFNHDFQAVLEDGDATILLTNADFDLDDILEAALDAEP